MPLRAASPSTVPGSSPDARSSTTGAKPASRSASARRVGVERPATEGTSTVGGPVETITTTFVGRFTRVPAAGSVSSACQAATEVDGA